MKVELGTLLTHAAARFGERTALVIDGRSFSFAELDSASNRLARALVGLGIGKGDRVSLFGNNSWRWIVGYYGILKANAVVNPLNAMLTPEEVAYATSDCQARLILVAPERAGSVLDVRGETPLEGVISLADAAMPGAMAFDDLLSAAHGTASVIPDDPGELGTIGYTSGTTGHPKGAMQTRRANLLNAAMYSNMLAETAQDTVVTGVPCAHVYGTILLNGTMLTGAKLVQMSRFDPDEALDLIATHKATMFGGVPTMYMYMLNAKAIDRSDLSSLTRCMVGGQTMPVSTMEVVEDRFACDLLELWGMTEIAGAGTTMPAYGERRLGSIGVPLPQVECRIADANDAGKTMKNGEDGELMVRGPIVMRGYFGNPRATAETIEPDGWLHTGDIARRDADGFYFVVDRKKDMIITAGYNVYPAEIERVVAAHPAVGMVAVGSQPDALKGEVAKAYVVTKAGASLDADDIMAHCRRHLAAYKVPRAVQFVDDLPKTSSGKIMRRALRSLDA
jgi:long-chain acyl-CoA synthetase